MFRAVCRSSSGAPTGLHTHVVTARNQVRVGTGLVVTSRSQVPHRLDYGRSPLSQFPLRLDCGRSPHAYVNQRLQIQLGLLMMSDIPLETCWAFNVLWNNKFRYQVASCWLLLLSDAFNLKPLPIFLSVFWVNSFSLPISNIFLCNSATSADRFLGSNDVLLVKNVPKFLRTLLHVGNLFYPDDRWIRFFLITALRTSKLSLILSACVYAWNHIQLED